MKITVSMNDYTTWKNVLLNKKNLLVLSRSIAMSTKTMKSFDSSGRTLLFMKNLLFISKYTGMSFPAKMFSVNTGIRTQLMNLQIATTPNFLNSLLKAFNCFLIKDLDNEFNMNDFISNTRAALVVVSRLLSELKFSDLEELLTEECKLEVEKNVRMMHPDQRLGLVVNEDDIYYSFPHQTSIIKGGPKGENVFFQVMMVYHICKDFKNIIQKGSLLKLSDANLEMFMIYNCRFIKDFTKGVNDQWTINGINVCKMHEY